MTLTRVEFFKLPSQIWTCMIRTSIKDNKPTKTNMEQPLSRQQQHPPLPRISPRRSSRTQDGTTVNNGTTHTAGIYSWMNKRHRTLEKRLQTENRSNTKSSNIHPSTSSPVLNNSTNSNNSYVNYNNNNNINNKNNNNNNNNNGGETCPSSIQNNTRCHPISQQGMNAPKSQSYMSPPHLSHTLEEDYRRAQYRIEQERKRVRGNLSSNAYSF
jgi:hypothetical protein